MLHETITRITDWNATATPEERHFVAWAIMLAMIPASAIPSIVSDLTAAVITRYRAR